MNKEQSTSYVNYATIPPFANADPKLATKAVADACANAIKIANELASSTDTPTWDTLIGPLDEAMESIDREYSFVAHLHAVTASKQWDEANLACIGEVTKATSIIGQNADLYKRLEVLNKAGVEKHRQRILTHSLDSFKYAGVSLPLEQRKQFAQNEQKLAQLSAKFEEHIREATSSWSHTITDEDKLGDMSEDMKNAAKVDGGWEITLLDPSYVAYMTHGTDRELRKSLHRARNDRASDLGNDKLNNLPLVDEILDLRWKQAQLLDFESPAAMILERRMAKTPDTVADFIETLIKAAKPKASAELKLLQAYASKELDIDELEPWDIAFVAERYKQATVGISDADIRPYFNVDNVLQGLFDCAQKLFGVTISKVETSIWEPSVLCFVISKNEDHIGHLYLDLTARQNKRGGAWAHDVMCRCVTSKGLQHPIAVINCNYTKATKGKSQQLSWEEVITIFHEAGHALHMLLSTVDDYCASGFNGVEWDAVELPSQFLENFAWEKETMLNMSSHVDTNEKLPQEMYEKLTQTRNFLPGLFVTRQLSLGKFDLDIHSQQNINVLEKWKKALDQCVVTPQLKDDRTPCSFGHVFAGGYATGYYGYLWADVLSADIYQMFAKDDADIQHLGQQFAKEVLERGGTRDAIENFQKMRGREPKPDALLERLGMQA